MFDELFYQCQFETTRAQNILADIKKNERLISPSHLQAKILGQEDSQDRSSRNLEQTNPAINSVTVSKPSSHLGCAKYDNSTDQLSCLGCSSATVFSSLDGKCHCNIQDPQTFTDDVSQIWFYIPGAYYQDAPSTTKDFYEFKLSTSATANSGLLNKLQTETSSNLTPLLREQLITIQSTSEVIRHTWFDSLFVLNATADLIQAFKDKQFSINITLVNFTMDCVNNQSTMIVYYSNAPSSGGNLQTQNTVISPNDQTNGCLLSGPSSSQCLACNPYTTYNSLVKRCDCNLRYHLIKTINSDQSFKYEIKLSNIKLIDPNDSSLTSCQRYLQLVFSSNTDSSTQQQSLSDFNLMDCSYLSSAPNLLNLDYIYSNQQYIMSFYDQASTLTIQQMTPYLQGKISDGSASLQLRAQSIQQNCSLTADFIYQISLAEAVSSNIQSFCQNQIQASFVNELSETSQTQETSLVIDFESFALQNVNEALENLDLAFPCSEFLTLSPSLYSNTQEYSYLQSYLSYSYCKVRSYSDEHIDDQTLAVYIQKGVKVTLRLSQLFLDNLRNQLVVLAVNKNSNILVDTCSSRATLKNYELTLSNTQIITNTCALGCNICSESVCLECNPFSELESSTNTCNCKFNHDFTLSQDNLDGTQTWTLKTKNIKFLTSNVDLTSSFNCGELLDLSIIGSSSYSGSYLDELYYTSCTLSTQTAFEYLDSSNSNDFYGVKQYIFQTEIILHNLPSSVVTALNSNEVKITLKTGTFEQACNQNNLEYRLIPTTKAIQTFGCTSGTNPCSQCLSGLSLIPNNPKCSCPSITGDGVLDLTQNTPDSLSVTLNHSKVKHYLLDGVNINRRCSDLLEISGTVNEAMREYQTLQCTFVTQATQQSSQTVYSTQVTFNSPSENFLAMLKSQSNSLKLRLESFDLNCHYATAPTLTFNFEVSTNDCSAGCQNCDTNLGLCAQCDPSTSFRNEEKPWECLCYQDTLYSLYNLNNQNTRFTYEISIKTIQLAGATQSSVLGETIDCEEIFNFLFFTNNQVQINAITSSLNNVAQCTVQTKQKNYQCSTCSSSSLTQFTVVSIENMDTTVYNAFQSGVLQIYLKETAFTTPNCSHFGYFVPRLNPTQITYPQLEFNNQQYKNCTDQSDCLICNKLSTNSLDVCQVCTPFSTYTTNRICKCEKIFSYENDKYNTYKFYLQGVQFNSAAVPAVLNAQLRLCKDYLTLEALDSDSNNLVTTFNTQLYCSLQDHQESQILSANDQPFVHFTKGNITLIMWNLTQTMVDNLGSGYKLYVKDQILTRNCRFNEKSYTLHEVFSKTPVQVVDNDGCLAKGCDVCDSIDNTKCQQCKQNLFFNDVSRQCECNLPSNFVYLSEQTSQLPPNIGGKFFNITLHIFDQTISYRALEGSTVDENEFCKHVFKIPSTLPSNEVDVMVCEYQNMINYEFTFDTIRKQILPIPKQKIVVFVHNISTTLYYAMESEADTAIKINTDYFNNECVMPNTYTVINMTNAEVVVDENDESMRNCKFGCSFCNIFTRQCITCKTSTLLSLDSNDRKYCQCTNNFTNYVVSDNHQYNGQPRSTLVVRLPRYINLKNFTSRTLYPCKDYFDLTPIGDAFQISATLQKQFSYLTCQFSKVAEYTSLSPYAKYQSANEQNLLIIQNMTTSMVYFYEKQFFHLEFASSDFYYDCQFFDRYEYVIKNSAAITVAKPPCEAGCLDCDQFLLCQVCYPFSSYIVQDNACACQFNHKISELFLNQDQTYSAYLQIQQITYVPQTTDQDPYRLPCSRLANFIFSDQSQQLDLNTIFTLQCEIQTSSYTQTVTKNTFTQNVQIPVVTIKISGMTQEFVQYVNNGDINVYLDKTKYFKQNNCDQTYPLDLKITLMSDNTALSTCQPGCVDCYRYSNGSSECKTCSPHTLTQSNECDCKFEYQQSLFSYSQNQFTNVLRIDIKNMHLIDELKDQSTVKCTEILRFYDFSVVNQSQSYVINQLNTLDCSLQSFYQEESVLMNSNNAYQVILVPMIRISFSVTVNILKSYEKQSLQISLKPETVNQNCHADGNFNQTMIFNYDRNTGNPQCFSGCIKCSDSYSCDICHPDTSYDYFTGQCNCLFKYDESLYIGNQFSNESDKALLFAFENIKVNNDIFTSQYKFFDCAQIINAAILSNSTDNEQTLYANDISKASCYAYQYQYQSSVQLSDQLLNPFFTPPAQKQLLFSTSRDLRNQRKKPQFKSNILVNTQSNLLSYDNAEVYLSIADISDDLLAAYRQGKVQFSLNQNAFCQDCIATNPVSYQIQAKQKTVCDQSCVSCAPGGDKCAICNQFTTLDKVTGECNCKPSYTTLIVDTNYQDQQNIQIDAFNIRVDPNYILNGQTIQCKDILSVVNVNGIPSTQVQFVFDDLNLATCQVENSKQKQQVSYQKSNKNVRHNYLVSTVKITISNLKPMTIQAFSSNLFDFQLNTQKFQEFCVRKGAFDFALQTNLEYVYVVRYEELNKMVCPKGCLFCNVSTSCLLCGPFSIMSTRAPFQCNCNTSIQLSNTGSYYDETFASNFHSYKYVINNVQITNYNLLGEEIPCNRVLNITVKRGITEVGRQIIQSSFNYTKCTVTQDKQTVYFYNNMTGRAQWIEQNWINVQIKDISQNLLEGFRREYFTLFLNPKLFFQNCNGPTNIELPADYIETSQCSIGCSSCVDFYSCLSCYRNISVLNNVTKQCDCNSQVNISIFKNTTTSLSTINFDLFDYELNEYVVKSEQDGVKMSVSDFFSIEDIQKSSTIDPDSTSQLINELQSIGNVYILEHHNEVQRIKITNSRTLNSNKTYTRVQLYGLSYEFMERLKLKEIQLFIGKQNVYPSISECLAFNGSISIPIETSKTFTIDNLPSVSENCLVNDQFNYCLKCNDGTLQYISFDRLQQKSCTEICPLGTKPDQEQQMCIKCENDCRICSSTQECFACSSGIKPLYYSNLNETVSQLQCIGDESCPSGFGYNPFTKECAKCASSSCVNCATYYLTCVECDKFSRLVSGSCQSTCAIANQFIENGQCTPCSQNCASCQFNSTYCTSCASGFFLDPLTNECKSQASASCPEGYFLNQTARTCDKCLPNCVSCSSRDQCNQCDGFSILESATKKCIPYCPIGKYAIFNNSIQSFTCTSCSSNCMNCWSYIEAQNIIRDKLQTGNKLPARLYELTVAEIQQELQERQIASDQEMCSQCKDNLTIFEGQCVTQCPGGSFEIIENTQRQCRLCQSGCSSCSSQITCQVCKEGFNLVQIPGNENQTKLFQELTGLQCKSQQCPEGTFLDTLNSKCNKCPQGCAKCDSTGACIQQCDPSCLDCFSEPTNCIQCQQDSFLAPFYPPETNPYNQDQSALAPHTCVINCNSLNMVLNEETSQCQLCPRGCASCSIDGNCEQCQNGFVMNMVFDEILNSTVGVCNDNCFGGEKEQVDLNNVCQRCSKGCDKCLNTEQCEICNVFTIFDFNNTKKCYCQFNYELYPIPERNLLIIDTLNLQWSQSPLLNQNSSFNCSQIMNLSNSLESDIIAIRNLTCKFINSQQILQSLQNTPNIIAHSQDLRTRIEVQIPSGSDLLQKLLTQEFNITLNSSLFTQDCEANPSTVYYDLKLFERDYQLPASLQTQVVVPIVQSFNLKLDSLIGVRCMNFTVNITDLVGFKNNLISEISWTMSVTIRDPQIVKEYTKDLRKFDTLRKRIQDDHEHNRTLFISSNLTEMLTTDVYLKITAAATDINGFTVYNSTMIVIYASRDYITFAASEQTTKLNSISSIVSK